MNQPQRPAVKPEHLRTDVPNIDTSPISPALYGATHAFLPRQSAATTGISPQIASPSSIGARSAARAVCTNPQGQLPSLLAPSQRSRDDGSPERGRATLSPKIEIRGAASHALSPQSRLSPTRQARAEQSPSAAAALHAASHSPSPVRSPNGSPHRRANTLSTSQTGQISPVDLSRALAGAARSMASAPKDSKQIAVPMRNQALNFAKIPPLSRSSTRSTLHHVSQGNPGEKRTIIPSTLIPQTSLSVSASARDRAHSVGDEHPSRREIPRQDSSSSPSVSPGRLSETSDTPKIRNKQRPTIPPRQSHRLQQGSPVTQSPGLRDHRGLTVNGLADAMVASSLASSLASSRAASPAKRPLPPPSRRRSRSFSALYDLSVKYDIEPPRKPVKPPRPMKHTLRKPSETEDEEMGLVKRGRRHWMRKHPNKHHEGDRKRWRDKVTERERKRYEGIFAANRGLLVGPRDFKPSPTSLADRNLESNKVVNVIVRDIWERSRLPRDVLMEIYDLVAPGDDKLLDREQFVVGMWLIDQRLKGRKLPIKVSSSVWSSVRHPDGIKMKGQGG